jgi:hypothetical protein
MMTDERQQLSFTLIFYAVAPTGRGQQDQLLGHNNEAGHSKKEPGEEEHDCPCRGALFSLYKFSGDG